ncbi:MAG: outer membrane lipoprotein carrier protein LolA, partial [Pseudomonadota bacterium]
MPVKSLLLTIFSLFLATSLQAKTIVNSVSKKQMLLLKKVDLKYQKRHGIMIELEKTITMGMLGGSKQSFGEIWLQKGQMRLQMNKPDPSLIVAGKKYLWIESPAPKDFKGAKPQVLKASLSSKRAKSQGLIQLLTQGGLLKYFRVSGVQVQPGEIVYFLQPENQSVEFKRAQLVVDLRKKEITQLRYWDQVDNETL